MLGLGLRPAVDDQPMLRDVVLSMPGMNGWETLAALRQIRLDISEKALAGTMNQAAPARLPDAVGQEVSCMACVNRSNSARNSSTRARTMAAFRSLATVSSSAAAIRSRFPPMLADEPLMV